MTTSVEQPAGVRIERLVKRFGKLEVLKGIDLEIPPARITAIVGPNAAGKSTLIKSMIGLVKARPGDGRISVDGQTVDGDFRYRNRIGYMPQAAQFPPHLTGWEIIRLLKRLRGEPRETDEDLIEQFGLSSSLTRRVGTLSGGTRQKLNAVVAFLFRPRLLILDEPTAGLDPVASAILKDKVLRAPEMGTTVILTSHLLNEIEELAQHIVFLVEGRVAFQGSVERLKETTGVSRLERAIASLLRAAL
jgi:Cu-processing system ATP-binding protein